MGAAEKIIDRSKKNSRRRKKRRTEDFSSDSSSSSDSSDNEEAEAAKPEMVKIENNVHNNAKTTKAITVDEAYIMSDNEEEGLRVLEPLSQETHKKLLDIKLTSTILSNSTGFGANKGKNIDTNQIKETLAKDRAQLNNEYLMLMASSFGNDLDELRKKPDFTQKSLVTLAKALQSGSNMFDEDTLNAILSK